LIPGPDDLWFLPLGGCGEIGMNLNLYGHDGHWLMVDCGITFGRPQKSGPHIQMPDPGFIAERRQSLVALIVTHAHEDHVGAELARSVGVPRQMTGRNGDLFMLAPVPGIRRQAAPVGRLGLEDGKLVACAAPAW
jgi:mRNA degradation ribonuclease J1/J2